MHICMDKTCKHCRNVFEIQYKERNRKFCSLSCSASHNNRGVAHNKKRLPKSRICKHCKEEFAVDQCNKANQFCPACIEERVYNKQLDFDAALTDRSRRKCLVRKNGHQCSICKLTEWIGNPIPLELDHIDGNHTNNKRSNVRLICPNCHAQTDNYKGKNKGNGREWRRLRYKELFAPEA